MRPIPLRPRHAAESPRPEGAWAVPARSAPPLLAFVELPGATDSRSLPPELRVAAERQAFEAIARVCRPADHRGQVGPGRFAVLLAEPFDGGRTIAERLSLAVGNRPLRLESGATLPMRVAARQAKLVTEAGAELALPQAEPAPVLTLVPAAPEPEMPAEVPEEDAPPLVAGLNRSRLAEALEAEQFDGQDLRRRALGADRPRRGWRIFGGPALRAA